MASPKTEDPPGKPANKRGAARLAAVQALYQMELTGAPLAETLSEYEALRLGRELDGETYQQADAGWFRNIVTGVVTGQRDIDPAIHSALPADWPLSRIDTLLRAVLRAGAYELFERAEVPARAVISEYVDVAKAFFGREESGLVNAVLHRLALERRPGEVADRGTPQAGRAREESAGQ